MEFFFTSKLKLAILFSRVMNGTGAALVRRSHTSVGRFTRRFCSFKQLSPLSPADIFRSLSEHVVGQEHVKMAISVGMYKHLVGMKHRQEAVRPSLSVFAPVVVNDALLDRQALDGFGLHEDQKAQALQQRQQQNNATHVTSEHGLPAAGSVSLHSGKVVRHQSIEKSNILLLGPTGTGKTLLAQTLADLIGVPMVITDATTLTQAGYMGEDVESVLAQLYARADHDMAIAERGIVYVDEIDKIARKSVGPSMSRDVSGEGVQQGLLKLLEGSQVSIPRVGLKRRPGGDTVQMDTTNVLFICAGSFAGIEEVVARRLEREGGAGEPGVQNDDLIKFGMIPEFIGRFPIVTSTSALSVPELTAIIHKPKHALLRQYEYFFALHRMELAVSAAAFTAIAEQAEQRGTGARGLRAILEKLLTPVMFHLPNNLAAFAAQEGRGSPESTYSDNDSDRDGNCGDLRDMSAEVFRHTALVDEGVVRGERGVLMLHGDLTAEEVLAGRAEVEDSRVMEVTAPVL